MNQPGQGFKLVTRGGLRFDRCPKAWIRDEARGAAAYLTDYAFLDKYKILPEPGGRLDQCPRFLEAVEVIEGARIMANDAQERRDKARAAVQLGRGKRGR